MPRIRHLPLFLIALAVLWPEALHAEPSGSPASILKKGQWVMGLGGGSLVKREMKGNAEATAYNVGHYRGYGLTDRLSLYGKIGAAYLEVDDATIIKASDPSATNDFGLNVLSSGQVKYKIFEDANQTWEWDGSLQYVDIRKRHTGKNEAQWHEWAFATSVARAFGRIKPYLGVKYSVVDFQYKIRENGQLLQQGHYKEDGPVGVFFGTDAYFGEEEDVLINVESTYLNGAEVDVAIAYTF